MNQLELSTLVWDGIVSSALGDGNLMWLAAVRERVGLVVRGITVDCTVDWVLAAVPRSEEVVILGAGCELNSVIVAFVIRLVCLLEDDLMLASSSSNRLIVFANEACKLTISSDCELIDSTSISSIILPRRL